MNRFLAARGVASRRAADQLVEAGRVRVNARPARTGQLVDPAHDRVTVDGRPVPAPVAVRTLMLNKPRGVVSTRRDPQGRPTVLDLVDEPDSLLCVGRLDADSRGLIVLTTDGELAMRLAHPRHGVTKTYRVTVRGRAGERLLRGMVAGVLLADGPARALRARRVDAGRQGDVIEVVMAEGRTREVRRLAGALGAVVVDLRRIGVGPLRLGRLLEGQSRPLRRPELESLYAAAGLDPPPPGAVR